MINKARLVKTTEKTEIIKSLATELDIKGYIVSNYKPQPRSCHSSLVWILSVLNWMLPQSNSWGNSTKILSRDPRSLIVINTHHAPTMWVAFMKEWYMDEENLVGNDGLLEDGLLLCGTRRGSWKVLIGDWRVTVHEVQN